MNPTTTPSGLVAGAALNSAPKKELPKVGEKLLILWHPYSGAGYQFVSAQSAVQEGQQFIEVEVTSTKTAKIAFE